MLSERSQTQVSYCMISGTLHKTSRKAKPFYDMVVPPTRIGRNREQLPSGDRVSFWDDEHVLELERGDGCTTL